MPESHDIAVDLADVQLRGSSQDQRHSSVAPSQLESVIGGAGLSPTYMAVHDSQTIGEDYRFNGELVFLKGLFLLFMVDNAFKWTLRIILQPLNQTRISRASRKIRSTF